MTDVELTADELAAAKAAGMTPEEYAEFKNPQPDLSALTNSQTREAE